MIRLCRVIKKYTESIFSSSTFYLIDLDVASFILNNIRDEYFAHKKRMKGSEENCSQFPLSIVAGVGVQHGGRIRGAQVSAIWW